jgi:heme/copper-type cytochrome/quinol oxidase subunit 3
VSTLPYTSEVRPDTGLYNEKLGMWLFLAAEAMFFGALYSSYVFLRVANPAWADAAITLPLHLSFLNLLCTLGAAASIAQAWAVLKVDRGERPTPWLATFVVFSLLSTVLISLEHRYVEMQGINASISNFYGMYYLLIGLQRIHVLAAALAGAYHLLLMRRRLLEDATRYANRLECLGLYWMFLSVLWVFFMLLFHVL